MGVRERVALLHMEALNRSRSKVDLIPGQSTPPRCSLYFFMMPKLVTMVPATGSNRG
jgi:hypothetical protein